MAPPQQRHGVPALALVTRTRVLPREEELLSAQNREGEGGPRERLEVGEPRRGATSVLDVPDGARVTAAFLAGSGTKQDTDGMWLFRRKHDHHEKLPRVP